MRNQMMKFVASILALVLCFSLLASCSAEETDDTSPTDNDNSQTDGDGGDKNKPTVNYGSKLGDTATPYDLECVLNDEKVNIKDYRGKIVVVNFWGTWCPPCRAELPDFDRVASENNDVVIIAVHSDHNRENAADYVIENLYDSKIVFAYDQPRSGKTDFYYALLGGVTYYPYTVILDADGVITFKREGSMSYEQLTDAINSARN